MSFIELEHVLVFAGAVIVISISGVMSPGPLFAANVFYGLKEGAKAGLKISYGHTIVELPLVGLLGLGILSLESMPDFGKIISILGALGLFGFALLQLKNILKKQYSFTVKPRYSSFLAGIMFSGLNPFFLIWWLTIGFKLISDVLELWSIWGIVVLFGLHIWMDYAWLISTAYLSSKSSRFLTTKTYKMLFIVISGFMIYFGITFLIEGLFYPQSIIPISSLHFSL